MDIGRVFNLWLGLVGLGVVLYFVFNDTHHTADIIQQAGTDTGSFIASLQGA
jgi:hypothetical protein